MRTLRDVGVLIAAGGLTLVLAGGWSQTGTARSVQNPTTGTSIGPSPASSPSVPSLTPPDISSNAQMEHEQAKMRNNDRQKQLVQDTQRLLALANELKTDVDKSNKDTLSLDVIRKADEIEKLAHNVKEKMKGT